MREGAPRGPSLRRHREEAGKASGGTRPDCLGLTEACAASRVREERAAAPSLTGKARGDTVCTGSA